MDDEAYHRYVRINLPHARTVAQRIERSLEALGAFTEGGNGGAPSLRAAYSDLEQALSPFEEDPGPDEATKAADGVAERARSLVGAILKTPARSDRLGQHVRNLFECLGLANEGAELSLQCGERPDSPLR
ncbi:MAG TPA: hypothetical protein VGQ78_08325 [Vicinamibacteria bacterium]|jgi:hypothetical protein|nr:hypothetical protein [Vicinamibacteria bacterium]